jgi:hypothetical protein
MRWGGKIANAQFLACIAVTDVLLSLTLAAILKTDSLIRPDSCQSSPPLSPPPTQPVMSPLVISTISKRRMNEASILASFSISKRNEPAYSRTCKDRSFSALLPATLLSNPRWIHSGRKDKEKEGYGLLGAVICYKPPPPPPPPPPPFPILRVCRTACGHVIRIRGPRESPPLPPIIFGTEFL